jgi:hypothetical protein
MPVHRARRSDRRNSLHWLIAATTGEEIKACDDAGIVPLVPKVLT